MTRGLYIWIPRNGGTSVHTRMSEATFERRGFGREYSYDECKFLMVGHHTLQQVSDAGLLASNHQVFAVLRNPWDRMVSLYHYWRNRLQSRGRLEFATFFKLATDSPVTVTPIKNVDGVGHASPQVRWLELDGQPFRRIFLMRFEMIQAAWHHVCLALNMRWKGLSRQNGSEGRKPYHDYYDDETKQLVADFYAEDIRLGQYRYEANRF